MSSRIYYLKTRMLLFYLVLPTNKSVEPDFALMLRRHAPHILPFIKTRLTNAMSEEINRIIKIVKNRASGFANLEAFTDMIFLTIGDVDIPAHIPLEFHTA